MKKFLFPALTVLMLSASSAAFAQSGPWYVVFHDRSDTCNAEHSIGDGGQQQTVGGPYASQLAAISAINHLGVCGGGARG